MARQFEYYYLQRNNGSTWETLEQSGSATTLTSHLNDRMAALGGVGLRIVGANFNEAAGAWLYEQLFYIDPSTVDLTGVDRIRALTFPDKGESGGTTLGNLAPAVDQVKVPKSVSPPARSAISRVNQGELAQVNMRLAYLALTLGGIIAALAFGIRSGFGLYLGPISLEFGYGFEVFAFSLAIQNLIWGLVQPFAGALADRYGPFKAIALGTVLYSAGTIMLSFADTPGLFHLSAGVLVGAALAGTSFGIILSAVSQLFPLERRSWALGVVGAAGSLGQFLVVPASQALLDAVGWSSSALIMGVVALLMLPLGLIFLKARPAASIVTGSTQTIGAALREAFHHPSFWFLSAGFFVCGFHVAFIAVHLPSFVVDIGLSAQVGAWALGLVGLFNVIGSYSAGVLGDKYPKKYLLSSLYLGRSIIMVGLVLLPPSELLIYVFAGTMGLLWLSTVPLTSGLVADIFGPRYMSTLFGIVFLSHQIGAFLGAWLGGYAYDALGSYDAVWWIAVALGLFSAIIHWPIREDAVVREADVVA
jgi:MFS family permease